jgi:hypothetical protein
LLIVGIVEAAKEFGIEGKASRALVLVLGVVFVGLSEGIGKGLIPAEYVVWVEHFVTVVAGGLAAMGYYDLSRDNRGLLRRYCAGGPPWQCDCERRPGDVSSHADAVARGLPWATRLWRTGADLYARATTDLPLDADVSAGDGLPDEYAVADATALWDGSTDGTNGHAEGDQYYQAAD